MKICIVKCKGWRKDCLGEFYILLFYKLLGRRIIDKKIDKIPCEFCIRNSVVATALKLLNFIEILPFRK